MPLIMEDDINVDDLFGEPSSLGLGLPSASSTKGLPQRLDEMRLLGCCQKIAWSRLGCIAYITQDGLGVNVRNLQCQSSDGKWVLSESTPLIPVTEAHGGHQLVHLCWNETGSELAVADSSGRVSIYSILIALNSIAGQRQAAFDPDDDRCQIVGMMWLNTQRSVHAFYQAAKMNGRWAYSPFRRRPIGPFHPANKAALLCVTRSGMLRLLYQNPDSRWAEISAELRYTGYTDRLLTHAAIVATQGGILIATSSACQNICLYRLQITWNPAQWDPSQVKQPPAANMFPAPSFHFVHCKIEIPSNILRAALQPGENSENILSLASSFYSLTCLEIVPGPLDNPPGSMAKPWLFGVFSKPLHLTSSHSEQQMPSSVILRWQLDTAPQSFHPKFDEVAKRAGVQAKPKIELRRLEDIHCDKYVVSIDQTEYGNALAVTYDDSSITFHDPKTMAVFNGIEDPNTATSLAQAGFHCPTDGSASGLYTSFSPNCCAAAMLNSDGQVQLRLMEHSYGAEGDSYDENKFSVAIASLTLAFCRGCGSDINTDDILLTVLQQLTPDAQVTFINEVYRALPINCNFTVEQDKLMNHPYIPRCLSMQAALGFKGRYKPRTLTSAVPWAILHLRHASVLFAYFFQYNKGAQPEPHDPDVLRMVVGNATWALDFLHYILNELFELADEFESTFADQEAFAQKVKNATSLPLIILLSSMSRAFLRFICRGLRGVYAGYANSVALVGDARIHYAEICRTIESSPVRIDVYEKFLAGVDSAVGHAYHGAGFGDAERPGPEKELLVNARIPPVLITAVATTLRQTVPALKPEIDRMAIYLGDYSWLGFGADPQTELYKRRRDVDALKKIPLRAILPGDQDTNQNGKHPSPQRRRRCARCCEVSGDIHPPRSLLSFRMIAKLGLLRSCLCGGMWALELGNGQTAVPIVNQAAARTPGIVGGLPGSS